MEPDVTGGGSRLPRTPPGKPLRGYGVFFDVKRRKIIILGGTDLRIDVSGAKFDAEDDFEVRLALAPPKPGQIDKKLNFRSKKNRRFFFFDVEKSNVRNRLKRVLAKFGGRTAHV